MNRIETSLATAATTTATTTATATANAEAHVHAKASGSGSGPGPGAGTPAADTTPLRKAAILLVSLEQPLASQLLAQLDRAAVEAVTLEIAGLDRIDPVEQQSILEEFYGLGLRRLRFVFDDLARMDDRDIKEAYDDEDAASWALALAGAARPVRAKVLAALATASAAALQRHLERLGPFRLDDAEAAQTEVAERLRRLHDQGRLTLPDPNGQEAILV
jgi:flagellar motor switch protein FliG